ncbi:MAG TPA: cell division protein FtsQ/DivIB [Steroidobacteraceae bacterium]|nr:cell division protein FtsQ/DivIB [Steroidobacteraceae bacterium]
MSVLSLKKRNRRRLPQREWRLPGIQWRRIGAALAFFALAAGVAYGLMFALDQPIRVVSVEGKFQRVSPVQVEQAVTSAMHDGFMTVDLEKVRHRVEELPWVDHARIQRRWPDGLRVEITEQVAAARWGEAGLLNTRGELFLPNARHVPPELPRLTGPDGTEAQVAQRYLAAQGRLIEVGLRLAAVDLDARGAWQLELSNGISVRLGRRQVDDRLDRFIQAAVPTIAGRAEDIAYVDMRYSNGFAVGWKRAGNAANTGDAAKPKSAAPAPHFTA